MGFELRDLFTALYHDQRSIRCIVITGRGAKIFCAGGDLKERNNMTDEAWQTQHALFEQAVRAMMECPIPMIGAVNGAAFAGGGDRALLRFRLLCAGCPLCSDQVTLRIIPGAGGTQNLPRAVGVRRAKEIILTGTPFSAADAMDWGLANKLCAEGKLLEDALATAEKIAGNAPISTRQAKKAIDMSTQLDLKSGYAFEIEAYNRMVPTEDQLEGCGPSTKSERRFSRENRERASESGVEIRLVEKLPACCIDLASPLSDTKP